MEYKNKKNEKNCLSIKNQKEIEPLENLINTNDIIEYISFILNSIIKNNKKQKIKQTKGLDEPLYSKYILNLPINKYLIRVIKYTECENNTIIVAFLFMIKFIKKENFVLGINNVYRLILGMTVLAKKFLEDIGFLNSYYCEIEGMTVKELNSIEYSLFTRMNFDMIIKKEDVDEIYQQIYKSLPISRLNELHL